MSKAVFERLFINCSVLLVLSGGIALGTGQAGHLKWSQPPVEIDPNLALPL
ncbi:MAG TPA: hypothetical protein VMX13_15585 [Sedimentisphaerales bacterium]|nr:hypothetical protein [Sedimentisphaerales bacterium]